MHKRIKARNEKKTSPISHNIFPLNSWVIWSLISDQPVTKSECEGAMIQVASRSVFVRLISWASPTDGKTHTEVATTITLNSPCSFQRTWSAVILDPPWTTQKTRTESGDVNCFLLVHFNSTLFFTRANTTFSVERRRLVTFTVRLGGRWREVEGVEGRWEGRGGKSNK